MAIVTSPGSQRFAEDLRGLTVSGLSMKRSVRYLIGAVVIVITFRIDVEKLRLRLAGGIKNVLALAY